MKKTILILILLLPLLMVFLYSKISINFEDKNDLSIQENKYKNILDSMSLDEKIGQLVISGFDGYELDNTTKNLIKEDYIGGVILFSRNIKDSSQLLNLTNSLKEANKNNEIPLFISVDEEGGDVSRLPKDIPPLPSNEIIGNKDSISYTENIATALSKELNSFGFNMNYAPVLDINSNSKNPVIGNRSYGNNPSIVSKHGLVTMNILKENNIIPVVKHFPGHGDTSVDSHLALPIVEHDIERLMSFELIPFKEAINNGSDVVMVSHILLPKIDKDNPSSLSNEVINNILRKKLNFNGVVITDDLTMGAILENFNIGNAAVKALNAGNDLLLICHNYENVKIALNAIKTAVKNGILTEKRIDESLYRILSLKEKYNLIDNKLPKVYLKDLNDKINSITK